MIEGIPARRAPSYYQVNWSQTKRTIFSDAYLNDSLYAIGFSARYFIVLATDAASFSSLMCKTEVGEGAKSWMFGAPTTTGIDPTSFIDLLLSAVKS